MMNTHKKDQRIARIGALAGCIAVALGFSLTSQTVAAPFVLNNGPGDGSVNVGVDGFGAFGSSIGPDSTNAVYDPVGAGGPAGTSFESGVAIRFGGAGGRSFLTSGDIGGSGGLLNPAVLGGASTFTSGPLSFSLQQTLVPLFTGMTQTGSQLIQTYTITNTGGAVSDFELVRYLDGDLGFDGSLIDGGGRLFAGPTEVLFETDSATGTATSTTFVGITAEGGTIPVANRYEIDSFAGLRSRIIAGNALDDTVTGDGGDPDQFIDAGGGYDVTLALRNLFSIAPGGSSVYTTNTIFGSGAPDTVTPVIPEPATCLFGLALAGVCFTRGSRRRMTGC
jgi:hypothetical protein